MPSAYGNVHTMNSGGKFNAVFLIDDVEHGFHANIYPTKGNFHGGATMEYSDKGQLSGSRDVDGKLTSSGSSFTVSNGPKITSTAVSIDGTTIKVSGPGVWSTD